jgi:hypothetical protein
MIRNYFSALILIVRMKEPSTGLSMTFSPELPPKYFDHIQPKEKPAKKKTKDKDKSSVTSTIANFFS